MGTRVSDEAGISVHVHVCSPVGGNRIEGIWHLIYVHDRHGSPASMQATACHTLGEVNNHRLITTPLACNCQEQISCMRFCDLTI